MKLTVPGKDVIIINESNILSYKNAASKIHLIKFKFAEPTETKIDIVLNNYLQTNRFIISDNIKLYNDTLKYTSKKYYVTNTPNQGGLISFFRKNNKVMLSVPNLIPADRRYVLTHGLDDILRNLEVIMIDQSNYEAHATSFQNWTGDVIIYDAAKHQDYL